MDATSKILKLAAQMALQTNMPLDYYNDWKWPKGMQDVSWRKVYDTSTKARKQCLSWAVALRKIADDLGEENDRRTSKI